MSGVSLAITVQKISETIISITLSDIVVMML